MVMETTTMDSEASTAPEISKNTGIQLNKDVKHNTGDDGKMQFYEGNGFSRHKNQREVLRQENDDINRSESESFNNMKIYYWFLLSAAAQNFVK
ncbi:hypothetical protein CQW23_18699 [Capsicum baccatum]|uniref:Uncharacterized protein n=1 Tax=Capsicum baccatum TaxID=33114 RepID=A0A2G2W3P3_CAPBA|nr:hypothetical protein CQW23_18699 [Capsicum baccatum]